MRMRRHGRIIFAAALRHRRQRRGAIMSASPQATASCSEFLRKLVRCGLHGVNPVNHIAPRASSTGPGRRVRLHELSQGTSGQDRFDPFHLTLQRRDQAPNRRHRRRSQRGRHGPNRQDYSHAAKQRLDRTAFRTPTSGYLTLETIALISDTSILIMPGVARSPNRPCRTSVWLAQLNRAKEIDPM